jgi:hypothetical protein
VPALEGALTYAQSYALANQSHKVAVVLITDGLPNECTTPDTPVQAANIASVYANGSPQVLTYVIGIGADVLPSSWNQIAVGGGTNMAAIAMNSPEIQIALNNIRNAFATCP